MVVVDEPVPAAVFPDAPAVPGVSNFNVKGAWNPNGSWTATPLIVAAKAAGAPATTVTGPLAVTMCDWPEVSTPVNSTVPLLASVAEIQHSPVFADSASE